MAKSPENLTARLAKQYGGEIAQTARILANGWTPGAMRKAGFLREAQEFGFMLGFLQRLELGPIIQQEKEKILKAQEQQEVLTQTKPTQETSTAQPNFYNIVPRPPKSPIYGIENPLEVDPESRISVLHQEYPRDKTLAAEVSRAWRELLNAKGWSPKDREERASRLMEQAIERLREAGFLDRVLQAQTSQELIGVANEIRQIHPTKVKSLPQ